MKDKNLIMKQAEDLKQELICLRRKIHSQPELGFEEKMTSKLVADYIKGLGLEITERVAKTGVVGILKGELPGSTVILRADMDALPIQEENEINYKSKVDGIMHACGHDAHMAILLGAARLLVNNRCKLKGAIKFIFQPAEEYISGAQAMIDEGVLLDPVADIALALHVSPDIESGRIEVKEGIIMYSMDEFEITVLGKGGHGSSPQSAINPIIAGAQLITALQTITSGRIAPDQPAVVSVCQFVSGTKSNVIPSKAYVSGTIRCVDKSVRNEIIRHMHTITKGICDASGAEYILEMNRNVPAVVNDRNVMNDFVACSSELLDSDKILIPDRPKPYSEDFAFFGERLPSMYFFLGTFNKQKDCTHPTHSAVFKIDDDILPLGAALLSNYCINRSL